jgi:hypothetical protein
MFSNLDTGGVHLQVERTLVFTSTECVSNIYAGVAPLKVERTLVLTNRLREHWCSQMGQENAGRAHELGRTLIERESVL